MHKAPLLLHSESTTLHIIHWKCVRTEYWEPNLEHLAVLTILSGARLELGFILTTDTRILYISTSFHVPGAGFFNTRSLLADFNMAHAKTKKGCKIQYSGVSPVTWKVSTLLEHHSSLVIFSFSFPD